MSRPGDHSSRSTDRGAVRSVGALSVVVLTVLALLGPPGRRPTAAQAHPAALAARTVVLDESAYLHLTSKHGFTLNEQGSASGTVTGTIYVHLTAVSNTRVTAEINVYHGGSSISGNGTGSYYRSAGMANFNGSMSIDRGSGSYAHVHGSGLSFGGAILESKRDAITVHVRGNVSV
jgi:hypothetical protein